MVQNMLKSVNIYNVDLDNVKGICSQRVFFSFQKKGLGETNILQQIL